MTKYILSFLLFASITASAQQPEPRADSTQISYKIDQISTDSFHLNRVVNTFKNGSKIPAIHSDVILIYKTIEQLNTAVFNVRAEAQRLRKEAEMTDYMARQIEDLVKPKLAVQKKE